jgi:hypothetical protein
MDDVNALLQEIAEQEREERVKEYVAMLYQEEHEEYMEWLEQENQYWMMSLSDED